MQSADLHWLALWTIAAEDNVLGPRTRMLRTPLTFFLEEPEAQTLSLGGV